MREARKEEMQNVYTKVPVQECYEATGKGPIGTKWVDINKGDTIHPEYRSRLVAKEIKTDKRLDLFAGGNATIGGQESIVHIGSHVRHRMRMEEGKGGHEIRSH